MPGPDNLPSTLRNEPAELSPPERLFLVRTDQQRRWRSGERVSVETYLQQDPALFADHEALLEVLLAEVMLREELGEQPRPDEYIARFEEHAAEILRLFELHRALQEDEPGPSDRETQ